MKQETPCDEKHPNCRTERYNGMTCLKWSDADLTCVDIELNKVPIGMLPIINILTVDTLFCILKL